MSPLIMYLQNALKNINANNLNSENSEHIEKEKKEREKEKENPLKHDRSKLLNTFE